LHHTSPFSHGRSTIGVTGESAAVLKPNAVPAQPARQRLKIAGLSPPPVDGRWRKCAILGFGDPDTGIELSPGFISARVRQLSEFNFCQWDDNVTTRRAMMREIKESDWKIFRQLHAVALERFCQRVLDDSERLHGDTSHTAYERYIAIYRLFEERDKEVALLFNDLRRSTALLQIAALKVRGLLAEEEFARFSQETQSLVAALLGELTA
jgi:hypothetical protein